MTPFKAKAQAIKDFNPKPTQNNLLSVDSHSFTPEFPEFSIISMKT